MKGVSTSVLLLSLCLVFFIAIGSGYWLGKHNVVRLVDPHPTEVEALIEAEQDILATTSRDTVELLPDKSAGRTYADIGGMEKKLIFCEVAKNPKLIVAAVLDRESDLAYEAVILCMKYDLKSLDVLTQIINEGAKKGWRNKC